MKQGLCKIDFERYLNRYGRDMEQGDNYGSKMRRNDPIQFDVEYHSWLRRRQREN